MKTDVAPYPHLALPAHQAKRVNIGIALITNPKVIFLDEPTSGLDSYTANEVMTLVRGFADRGTSVCATIHSPSASTFKLFHSVMVLLRGGVVYFGPAGAPALSFSREFWPSKEQGMLEGLTDLTDAEALVTLITEADRRGDSQALADIYSSSSLKKVGLKGCFISPLPVRPFLDFFAIQFPR